MSFLRILRPSTRFVVYPQCRTYATKTAEECPDVKDSPTPKNAAKDSSSASSKTIPLSSCPADTILPGVNYLKGQPPVVALPDDQYPPWLWTLLKPKVYPDDGPGGKAERVKRRLENKKRIKERNFMSTQ